MTPVDELAELKQGKGQRARVAYPRRIHLKELWAQEWCPRRAWKSEPGGGI